MTIKNQELYEALRNVSSKHFLVETHREALVQSDHQLALAKETARQVLEALPREQIEALMALPIQHGDTIIHLSLDEGHLHIEAVQEIERLRLHDLMGDEEREALRQRVDASVRKSHDQQQVDQEG